MNVKTRPPTGRVPWPLILIEGGEKAGKSWAAAELSASEHVGQTYWMDLGEGAADEYGAIPGTRYLVVEHDGSWGQLIEAVTEIRTEAARAAEAGEPPVVLVIDSMTAEWDLLKDWAMSRARSSKSNLERVRKDPHAEVPVSMDLWNDATSRHRRLMTMLMTFPGVVVMTARGKEVVEVDGGGKPTKTTGYKVEGHKNLAYDASAWIRVSRDHAPLIVGVRSVHAGIRPGVDRAQPNPGLTLEKLIFGVLRCDSTAAVRQISTLTADTVRDEALAELVTVDELRALHRKAQEAALLDASVVDEHGDDTILRDLIARIAKEKTA